MNPIFKMRKLRTDRLRNLSRLTQPESPSPVASRQLSSGAQVLSVVGCRALDFCVFGHFLGIPPPTGSACLDRAVSS